MAGGNLLVAPGPSCAPPAPHCVCPRAGRQEASLLLSSLLPCLLQLTKVFHHRMVASSKMMMMMVIIIVASAPTVEKQSKPDSIERALKRANFYLLFDLPLFFPLLDGTLAGL